MDDVVSMTGNSAPILMDISRLIWRRWTGVRPTGIDRTCLAYLEHFADRAQAVVQHRHWRRILSEEQSRKIFDLLLHGDREAKVQQAVQGAMRFLVAYKNLPGNDRLYFNVGHTGLDNPAFLSWCQQGEVRPVYFVHDLIPITHPEYCREGEDDKHRRRMLAVLDSGVGVIGNSAVTIRDVADFAAAEGRAMLPSLAAWLGTTPLTGRPSSPAGKPYFLMLGTIEARKNHLFLLQLWSQLVAQLGEAAPALVIVGRRGWECEQAVDLLERSPAVRSHVTELNDCDDQTLTNLLHGARALLFPSLAEGFGLPVVEAMQAGLPVIASDLPIFREVGRGLIDLIDPLDGPGWRRAIQEYAQPDSPRRAAHVQNIAGVTVPSWQDHFAQVERWLTTL